VKTKNGQKLPDSKERALLAAKLIAERKCKEIKILDLRKVTQYFDFFVIATGTSRRQLHAVSEEIDEVFEKELGDVRRSVSGYVDSRWIVLDYDDVVIHLFDPETREYYALEDLWGKGTDVPFNSDFTGKKGELEQHAPTDGSASSAAETSGNSPEPAVKEPSSENSSVENPESASENQ